MFGMGWQEILLILVVAVLVIGPDQLPQVARTIGRTITQFRRLSNELRDTVNREFTENEDFKEFREFHQSIDAEFRDIGKAAQNYVEKEIAAEEGELSKFAEEVRGAGKHLAEEGEKALEAGKSALDDDVADADHSTGAEADDRVGADGSGTAAASDTPAGAGETQPADTADEVAGGDEIGATAPRAAFEPPQDSHAYVPDEAQPAPAGADSAAAAAEPASAQEPEPEGAAKGTDRKETA